MNWYKLLKLSSRRTTLNLIKEGLTEEQAEWIAENFPRRWTSWIGELIKNKEITIEDNPNEILPLIRRYDYITGKRANPQDLKNSGLTLLQFKYYLNSLAPRP